MFGLGRGRKNKVRGRRQHGCGEVGHGRGCGCGHNSVSRCINLDEAEIGRRYRVMTNPDKKTMEMGIYHTSVITVHKKEESNPNIVVGVGESRYIIPRNLAKRIILSLFQERKIISLSDLIIHFNADSTALQAILQKLIDKGLVEHLNLECNSCSSSCEGCSFANDKDIYKLI